MTEHIATLVGATYPDVDVAVCETPEGRWLDIEQEDELVTLDPGQAEQLLHAIQEFLA